MPRLSLKVTKLTSKPSNENIGNAEPQLVSGTNQSFRRIPSNNSKTFTPQSAYKEQTRNTNNNAMFETNNNEFSDADANDYNLEAELPEGWEAKWSKTQNTMYYMNDNTGETSWSYPSN